MDSKTCQFFEVEEQTLTKSLKRPRTFATFGIRTGVFDAEMYQREQKHKQESQRDYREGVYRKKQQLKIEHSDKILDTMKRKERNRELLMRQRLFQERQKKFLAFLSVVRFLGTVSERALWKLFSFSRRRSNCKITKETATYTTN